MTRHCGSGFAEPPHPELRDFPFRQQDQRAGRVLGHRATLVQPGPPCPFDLRAAWRFGARAAVPVELAAGARSRGVIVVAPTAIGSTWSLMDPEIDSQNLNAILTRVRDRWNVDPARMLLSGMSDGGTFTLLSGLAEDSPFTHLAPVAASFHPMLLAMTEPERLNGLPIYLTHGALDWMFPVNGARTAARMLAAGGAAVTYREIADLSHAYPRDGQGEVLDWFPG